MVAFAATLAGVAVLLLAGASLARACGHCDEDAIAATYQYGVTARAHAIGHQVVYARMRGATHTERVALLANVRRMVERTPGVDRGTARVSLDPPAVSFACAGSSIAVERTFVRANLALASLGLQLERLRLGASAVAPVSARAARIASPGR
jgi:hypothetical protein